MGWNLVKLDPNGLRCLWSLITWDSNSNTQNWLDNTNIIKRYVFRSCLLRNCDCISGSAFPAYKKDTLRLYNMRFCPFTHRTRLVLVHKGIPWVLVSWLFLCFCSWKELYLPFFIIRGKEEIKHDWDVMVLLFHRLTAIYRCAGFVFNPCCPAERLDMHWLALCPRIYCRWRIIFS